MKDLNERLESDAQRLARAEKENDVLRMTISELSLKLASLESQVNKLNVRLAEQFPTHHTYSK